IGFYGEPEGTTQPPTGERVERYMTKIDKTTFIIKDEKPQGMGSSIGSMSKR
ncbi:hypothetical protein HAX54_012571, partial [Datura stramonium]|nr:hypothetical protein [Datura stramonium]